MDNDSELERPLRIEDLYTPAQLEYTRSHSAGEFTPLRIPGTWYMMFNNFWEIEPVIENGEFLNAMDFDEDLLAIQQIVPQHSNHLPFFIDVGWYPSEAIDGEYRLVCGTSWEDDDLKTYSSKDRLAIVTKLEQWLHIITEYPSSPEFNKVATDDNNALRLTPLRIPSGWNVIFNNFWEIEPIIENGEFINAEDFGENLLLLEVYIPQDSNWRPFFVVLRWYLSENVDGNYQITLGIRGQDEVFKTYSSKDRLDIVSTLERWLQIGSEGLLSET